MWALWRTKEKQTEESTCSVFLRFVQLRHLKDGQLVVLRRVSLRSRDDVRARGEALSLIALVIAKHIE